MMVDIAKIYENQSNSLFFSKIQEISAPVLFSISLSMSMKSHPRALDKPSPTVVLPAPIGPIIDTHLVTLAITGLIYVTQQMFGR